MYTHVSLWVRILNYDASYGEKTPKFSGGSDSGTCRRLVAVEFPKWSGAQANGHFCR